jgi:hypothetical protein
MIHAGPGGPPICIGGGPPGRRAIDAEQTKVLRR